MIKNRTITNKKRSFFGTLDSLILLFIITILSFALLSSQTSEAEEKKVFSFNSWAIDLVTSVNYNWGAKALHAYKSQIDYAINNTDLTATEVLDIFWIKSQECNRYDWLCEGFWGWDFWPFQINIIHSEQYYKSRELASNWDLAWLFSYQLNYATQLIRSYKDRFCGEDIFFLIGKTYTNEKRFKCTAVSYNGHPRYKHTFAEITWLKRQIISEWLVNNSNFKEFYNL